MCVEKDRVIEGCHLVFEALLVGLEFLDISYRR